MLANQDMDDSPLALRRILLTHLVMGSFLLPGWMRAALAVQLSTADVARIAAAVPPGSAAGTRYPAGGMKGVFL